MTRSHTAGCVGTASDGEQPTPARLRESRRAPGRMLGRELDQMARPCGARFANGRRFGAWGPN